MRRFESRTYSISDFVEWRDRGVLDFSPDFQRRYVWSDKAKSYLIDTVVKELPMPKLIISQTFSKDRQVRVVVDGQQRIRTLLEYYDGNFSIKRMHNEELGGKFFSNLDDDARQDFLKYQLGVDVLFDASYEELIEIFARINTYSVKLNPQELRNALYLGYFKQMAFAIGKQYASYWVGGKVLKQGSISRMGEAELASNLLIVCLSGIESNKVIENYYRKYEDEEGNLVESRKLFDEIMSVIGSVYSDEDLARTIFSREPLFYSLFAAVRNALEPLALERPMDRFSTTKTGRIRVALDSLSAEFSAAESDDNDGIRSDLARFVDVSRRRTADVGSRVSRTRYIASYVAERTQ